MTAVQAVSIALGAGVLKFAAGKITPVITSEISSIKGATKDLLELKDIHEEISSCLRLAYESGIDGGDPSVTKLKNVADNIDYLLHEAYLKVEIKMIDSDGDKYALVDCFPTKPKSLTSRFKIAHRIKAIKKTHAAILKQKSDTNTILNSLPIVALQGMRAGEQSLFSKVEEQKTEGTVQGEDDNKCTLSDSDEGMDDGWIEQKTEGTVQGEDDNKCTLSDSDEGMDDGWIVTGKVET